MLVEIWSDVVCPWCAVGRARFSQALGRFAHADEVEVIYRSFELDPDAPPLRRGSMAEGLAAKYGMSVEEAQQMNDHLTEVAALDGVELRFDRARPGNTFDAHRLLQYASARGCQEALVGAFLQGYFRDGRAIGEHGDLAEMAAEVGLPADGVASVLAGDDFADAVRADEARAAQLGISGVPFFLIEGKFAIPGAQPVDRFVLGLDRAWDKVAAA